MTNYNNIFHQQIAGLKGKPKLLLHVCCAPCSSGVIDRLVDHFDITYLYYNPNIYPFSEYELRKQQFDKLGIKVVDLGYNHDEYLSKVGGLEQAKEGGARCQKCIEMRLKQTFIYAKQHGYDFVSTTLTISPHKDCQFINETGKRLQQEYGVNYLFADFKKENGFLLSTLNSKKAGMYRQTYCGCEFSLPKQ